MSVNAEDKTLVLLGTEAGSIIEASLVSETIIPTAENTEELQWMDPVRLVFNGHQGRVLDIQSSPFHRDIVASVGSDLEIRIFSLLQPQVHFADDGLH